MDNEFDIEAPPQKPTITETVEALKSGAEKDIPSAKVFYGLSDLTSSEVAQIEPVWRSLADDYRRKLVRMMVENSENDFQMNYRAMAHVGLADADPGVREAAIDLLWEDSSLETLHRLIDLSGRDTDPQVRAATMKALSRYILLGEYEEIPEAEAQQAQQAALKVYNNTRETIEVRRRALEALGNSGNQTVSRMIQEAYQHEDRLMRISAVFAMGRTYDRDRWGDAVLTELDSTDPELQYEAVRAAGELELTEAVPKLTRLAADDDAEMREMIAWSLGEIGGREAMRVLEAMLEVAEENEDEALIEAIDDAIGTASLQSGDLFPLLDLDED